MDSVMNQFKCYTETQFPQFYFGGEEQKKMERKRRDPQQKEDVE